MRALPVVHTACMELPNMGDHLIIHFSRLNVDLYPSLLLVSPCATDQKYHLPPEGQKEVRGVVRLVCDDPHTGCTHSWC